MSASRRSFLASLLRAGGALLGFGGLLWAGAGLMRRREPGYPVEDPRRRQPEGLAREGSVSVDASLRPRLIRPPGALEEPAFLAACIRCTRCQDACDLGAIQYLGEAHGAAAHTPIVDPRIKACNLCMKCTQACPTPALTPLELKDSDRVAMGSVALSQDLCLSYKALRLRDEQALLMELGRSATEAEAPYERRGPCGECHMFCPLRERAITLEPGAFLAPIVHPEACVGCGLCEQICRRITHDRPAIEVVPTRQWT